MEFKEYLAVIRRRWLLFFPIFVFIVGAHLVWVSYGQQDRYAATSKVILGADRTNPSSSKSWLPMHELSRETKEATITDYPVLRTAAELALGERTFQSRAFQDPSFVTRIQDGQPAMRARYQPGEEGVDALVRELEEQIETKSVDREIVEITAECGSAEEAAFLSWSMAEGAKQYHEEKARESVDEFSVDLQRQLKEAEAELQRSYEQLSRLREEMNVSNFDDQEELIRKRLFTLDDQDSTLLAQIKKNDRLIQYRLQEQSFKGRLDHVDSARLVSSQRVEQITERLFEKKLEIEALIATLSPKHPEVQRARGDIAALEKQLASAQDSVLNEKYKLFSQDTNELIKQNALFALERDVVAERKMHLTQELADLNVKRQQMGPVELAYDGARTRILDLRELEKEVNLFAQSKLGTVVVYDPAKEAKAVTVAGGGYGPLTLTMLMAFIFALGVVYVVEYVDTRVKSEQDIRRHLNLPLLGIIPKESNRSSLLTDAPLQSEISEKFNTAATLIQTVASELSLKSIMVCSAIAREGKTTVSINLAIALARKGSRVVLVDGDLRISQIHNILNLPNHVGLVNALDTRLDPKQVIAGALTEEDLSGRRTSATSFVQATRVENLYALTSGPSCNDPVTLMESGRLGRVVSDLKRDFDYVIFDTPPINKVGDALSVSQVVDGSVFVVGSGQAEQHDVMWAKHLLTNVQSNILGVFLNKYSKPKGSEYYYYYYYNNEKRKRTRDRV
ncbi:MAG: polysaccharide biosynthesis tyrosine autokinase [Planctomycetota bacterium]